MGEGDIIRDTKVKPRGDTASSGKANDNICTSPGNTAGSGVHLKCLYTNAHNIRNKQDELKAFSLSQSYDIIGIIEP